MESQTKVSYSNKRSEKTHFLGETAFAVRPAWLMAKVSQPVWSGRPRPLPLPLILLLCQKLGSEARFLPANFDHQLAEFPGIQRQSAGHVQPGLHYSACRTTIDPALKFRSEERR